MCRGRKLLLPFLSLSLWLALGQLSPATARPHNGDSGKARCALGQRYALDACNECECRPMEPHGFDFRCSRRICLDVNPDIGFLLGR